MELNVILVYIFGALGIGSNVFIFQQKTGQRLIAAKLISDTFWVLHYIFLGAYSGVAVAGIAALRELVYLFKEKKWASSPLIPVFFMGCAIGSTVITWAGPISLLPLLASLIAVAGFWRKSPRLSRLLAYPIATSMLIYDIFCGSYLGIVNESFSMISATVGIIRYGNGGKKK